MLDKLKPSRILLLATFMMTVLMLSGCVSIPLTDGGAIEISADGITINSAKLDTETEVETIEKNILPKNSLKDKSAEMSQTLNETESTEEVESVEVEDVAMNEEGFGGCAHEFYLIVNRLPKGFPIPPCAYVRHFELVEDGGSNERLLVAHYEDHGLVNDAHEKYKDFFESAGFQIGQESIQRNVSILAASGDGMDITLSNEQTGADEVRTEFSYSEMPIKKYKIVESFINWTETGYGKCTDEYYTALSIVPLGFPIQECADVSMLQIEAHDEVIQGATSFIVNRYWTEEFEAYESFAESAGFSIINSEGLATEGELEIENDEYWINITTTKVNMEQTETMINVTYK